MHNPSALLEIHRLAHRGSDNLLAHCRGFTQEELARDLSSHGYGHASILAQWRHLIDTEDVWVNILLGQGDPGDRSEDCTTLDELAERLAFVRQQTIDYLSGATAEQLSATSLVKVWPHEPPQALCPALAIMRQITHMYHHRAQLAGMCRVLGQPVPGDEVAWLDFPLSAE